MMRLLRSLRSTRGIRSAADLLVFGMFCTAMSCTRTEEPDHPLVFAERVDQAESDFDETSFRSSRPGGLLASQVTMGTTTHLSLTPPLPSRLSFHLQVPAEPELHFSIGVASVGESVLPAPVIFSMQVNAGKGDESVFQEVVPRSKPDQWSDRAVDLGPWAGHTIQLTFETRFQENRQVRSNPSLAQSSALASWGNPVLSEAGAPVKRPNLVLISVDCLRRDHVGAYGYSRDTTPHINRMADDGVVFETAVASASWTLPTHMSMLTGLPPSLHGASKWRKLDGSVSYLPEMLARAGYQTKGIVSWVYLSHTFGFERGFHSYSVFDDPDADEIVDTAIETLRRSKGQPLFLFLHLFDAHRPYLPPKEFLDRFGPRPKDISDLLDKIAQNAAPTESRETQEIIDLYDAEVAFADEQLGRFFDELKKSNLYDNTLIILTADHGEAFYEHGHWEHSQTLYEEIIRVPLIAKWPGNTPKDRRSSMVGQVDIFPTLLEAADVAAPPTGAMNLLGGGPPSDSHRTHITSEVTWLSPNGTFMKISLREERFKYVATLSGPAGNPLGVREITREELYDLATDPTERANLADQDPKDYGERLKGFREQMHAYLDEARRLEAQRGGQEILLDSETEEKLRKLGYTTH